MFLYPEQKMIKKVSIKMIEVSKSLFFQAKLFLKMFLWLMD